MSDGNFVSSGRKGGGNHIIRPRDDIVFGRLRDEVMIKEVSDKEEEEAEEEDEDLGERRPQKMHDPLEPTAEERRMHELTHLPFRSWCKHCVKGRGKEKPCKKQPGEEGGAPELHVDFMFMGEPEGGRTLTLLVAKERRTRMVMVSVIPKKSSGEFAAKRVLAFMKEIGVDKKI